MAGALVGFHRLAAREYRKARDWYKARSPETALRFVQSVDRAMNRIAASPDALPGLAGDYRYVRITGFPFVLIFRSANTNSVTVFAVAHTSRRPGYWRRRR